MESPVLVVKAVELDLVQVTMVAGDVARPFATDMLLVLRHLQMVQVPSVQLLEVVERLKPARDKLVLLCSEVKVLPPFVICEHFGIISFWVD